MEVYMDNAATTQTYQEVVDAMIPFFTKDYGNASSLHSFGRKARDIMEKSRQNVADLISVDTEEVIFTAGGTESDNIAIKGIALKNKGGHIITSSIEHPAVLETCKYLEKKGFDVTYLGVDKFGMISLDELKEAIRDDTILITIMHANNEIGTIEPISGVGKIAKENNIFFHTDAVQSVGKVPIDCDKMGVDLLSISSHKIHGPKGVGALYVRKGVKLEPIIHGGGHEKGIRSSTENIAGIVGLGKACELAKLNMKENVSYLTKIRDKLIDGVLKIEESYLNGHPKKRLPNNAHFRFGAIEGESLLLSLDGEGIAASTGSACSSKKLAASHVLMAIGLSEVDAHGSLRLTLSRINTEEDVDHILEVLPGVVERLRQMSPLWNK